MKRAALVRDGRRPASAALRLAGGACLLALLVAPLRAERADRDKDANVTADHSTLDDLRQVEVLTGHVVLIKGTMRLGGERMEHRQDERGYQYYVVTAAPGELATFHERRDAVRPDVESTIDGYAERIEYDDRTDTVILTKRALVKRFENDKLRDELSGARIVYDGRSATYDVVGRGVDGSGDRVRIRVAPRSSPASSTESPPPAANAKAPVPAPAPVPPPQLQLERQAPEVGR